MTIRKPLIIFKTSVVQLKMLAVKLFLKSHLQKRANPKKARKIKVPLQSRMKIINPIRTKII